MQSPLEEGAEEEEGEVEVEEEEDRIIFSPKRKQQHCSMRRGGLRTCRWLTRSW